QAKDAQRRDERGDSLKRTDGRGPTHVFHGHGSKRPDHATKGVARPQQADGAAKDSGWHQVGHDGLLYWSAGGRGNAQTEDGDESPAQRRSPAPPGEPEYQPQPPDGRHNPEPHAATVEAVCQDAPNQRDDYERRGPQPREDALGQRVAASLS